MTAPDDVRARLLPCPLCGTDDHETSPWPTDSNRDWWKCNCGNPDCGMEIGAPTPEEAVAKWNRRAAHASGEMREVAAWQRRIKHDSGKWLAWVYFAGAVDYDNDRARFPDRVGRWECEYRPLYAHADLAGEVRELDENAAVRNALAGKKLYVMHPEHIADVHKPLNEITFGMVMDDKVLFACKQPAKFHPTHQEKP